MSDDLSVLLTRATRIKPRAKAYYDPKGDFVRFMFSDEDYFAERIDEVVTVFKSIKTKKAIGSLVKGVSQHFGTRIIIEDGGVRIAQVWTECLDDEIKDTLLYRRLLKKAQETKLEAKVSCESNQ